MTTITTRSGKGAPLTNAELDANFTALNAGKLETTATTTDIAEGTNQYFTDARARAAISATGSISYNSTTGVMSFTQGNTDTVSEGVTNLYFTNARARSALSSTTGAASYNATTGVITIPSTTAHITEGSNLYYTDARVRAAISAGTGISFNSTTGVIASTITQYTDANARAAISQVAGSAGYNSTTGVLTIPTTTAHITEGTNLYYTDARARAAFSPGTGMQYNSGTGTFNCTITQYTNAQARAAVSFVSGSGAYNSTTGVFTIPTNTSELTNGAGFITSSGSISGSAGSVAWSGVTGKPTTISGYGITDAITTAGGTITTTNGTGSLTITDTGTSGAGIRLNGNGATTPTKYVRAFNGQFQVVNNAYTLVLTTIDDSGNLTATANVTAYSDERLKKDWASVGVDFVDRLSGVKSGTYTRIDNDIRQAGVSAQSLQEVLPETVIEDIEGTLSVAYGNAALVAAVELAKEVVQLRKRLEALEAK